jgi:cyclic pyranopterin phosphate synthase
MLSEKTRSQPFKFMRITADSGCNFRCEKCNPEGKFDPLMMSTGEVLETVRAGVQLGIDVVHLIGGEPSKRKDIVELVAGMKQEGINSIEMTTNGVPFYRLAEDLALAGLTGVNISLDTFDPEKFRELTGRNALPFVLRAIEKARELFDKVAVNVVIMRRNFNEIADFIGFSRATGIMVRFCELTPHGPFMGTNPDFFDRNHVTKDEILGALQELAPLTRADKRDIDKQNAHSEYFTLGGKYEGMTIGVIAQFSNGWPCPGTECTRLRIGPRSANSCIIYPDRNLMGLSFEEKRAVLQDLVEEKRMQIASGFPARHDPRESYPLYRFGLRINENRVA